MALLSGVSVFVEKYISAGPDGPDVFVDCQEGGMDAVVSSWCVGLPLSISFKVARRSHESTKNPRMR